MVLTNDNAFNLVNFSNNFSKKNSRATAFSIKVL